MTKFGPKLDPKSQNLSKRPREAKKVTFSNVLKYWVWINHKKFNFFSLEVQNRSKMTKFGSKIGPKKVQNLVRRSREAKKVTFCNGLKHWVWIHHKKFKSLSLQGQNRPKMTKFGPKLDPKGQNVSRRPREAKKVTFPNGLKHWVWIFHEKN